MESLRVVIYIAGFVIVFLSHIYLVYLGFRKKFSLGVFCFLGGAIFMLLSSEMRDELRNNEKAKPVVIAWVIGFVMFFVPILLV